ncbi:MAG: 3-oxoacyl-ACP reductase FabG [Sulfobacillus sp.]
MARLHGKVAVVTGAGQGIGRAEALLLASHGAQIAVWDMNAERAYSVAQEINDRGGKAQGYATDVTQSMVVQDTMESVRRDLGPVNVLVNNAGITRDNLLFKMTDEDWDAMIDTHLKGSFLCTRAAQADMVAQRWGRIVFTSSTSALGNRGQANYSAAKAGLQGLTRTLAIELGPFNITVNAIAPGFIDTEMTRDTARRLKMDPEQLGDMVAKTVPLGRVGVPDDVAHVAAFFCSEEASYVSGQVIYVRGGP